MGKVLNISRMLVWVAECCSWSLKYITRWQAGISLIGVPWKWVRGFQHEALFKSSGINTIFILKCRTRASQFSIFNVMPIQFHHIPQIIQFTYSMAQQPLKSVDSPLMRVNSQLTPWLMESEGSMPHSQGLSNNPYPKLNQSIFSHW